MSRLAALVFALLSAVPLAAQDFADLCRQHRTFRTGQWASYRMTGGRSDNSTMRFAIVSAEGTGDGARYAYEMSFTRQERGKTETSIIQMLVSGLGTTAMQVHGLVMKTGDRPAMKMPDVMIAMIGRQATANVAEAIAHSCDNARVVGWETITVPAGTFRALHVRGDDGADVWVSREIPFGMVQVKSKDGSTMALTGRGTDAKTSITEAPQDMLGRRP